MTNESADCEIDPGTGFRKVTYVASLSGAGLTCTTHSDVAHCYDSNHPLTCNMVPWEDTLLPTGWVWYKQTVTSSWHDQDEHDHLSKYEQNVTGLMGPEAEVLAAWARDVGVTVG